MTKRPRSFRTLIVVAFAMFASALSFWVALASPPAQVIAGGELPGQNTPTGP